MKYRMIFKTPIGTYTTLVKEDSYELVQEKVYTFPERYKEDAKVTIAIAEDKVVTIPYNVLLNSVLEVEFNV